MPNSTPSTVRVTSNLPPFAMTPEWLLDADVSDRAVRLFGLLHRYEGERGIFPSHETLAARLRCSVSTLKIAIAELETVGAVTVHCGKTRGSTNVYELNFHRGVADPPATGSRPTGYQVADPPATERKKRTKEENDIPPLACARAKELGISDQDLYQLRGYGACFPDLDERLDEARAHASFKKYSDKYLYFRGWLRRDKERTGGPNGARRTQNPTRSGRLDLSRVGGTFSDTWGGRTDHHVTGEYIDFDPTIRDDPAPDPQPALPFLAGGTGVHGGATAVDGRQFAGARMRAVR